MNCTCKKDLEEKLTERFKNESPDATGHSVELSGYGFVIIENTMKTRGYMDVKAKADFPLKKGGWKHKIQTQNMFFSFCPFCGVKV